MSLRKDIYPNAKQRDLDRILPQLVTEILRAFQSCFTSEQDLIQFINRLPSREIVELFLDSGRFYAVSKSVITEPFVKLIMIFSMIERLTSAEIPYTEFKNWIRENEVLRAAVEENPDISDFHLSSLKQLIDSLREKYNEIYGFVRNILSYFTEYIALRHQIMIIASIHVKDTEILRRYPDQVTGVQPYSVTISDFATEHNLETSKGYMPVCYDWRQCCVDVNTCCWRSKKTCRLWIDDEERIKRLKTTIKLLYDFRSVFVHRAELPPFSEHPTFGMYKHNKKWRDCLILLKSSEFEAIFEESFVEYFKSKIDLE
ncbi:hypothetical protein [Candidatus Borrarchaeum sp.]|uniref:hypothetical protein n=1 Tax=Candidatus Borrarchaeum sp. TaxID=2846742 RepID=UPI00257BE88D|nr:hypothetical protein [Candidatus Borrarchaeum sp.]